MALNDKETRSDVAVNTKKVGENGLYITLNSGWTKNPKITLIKFL
jgi:hypothetical protein